MPGPKPPKRLVAMRHVARQPSTKDATEEQKRCRSLLDLDPKAFAARLDRLEKEHRDRLDEWQRKQAERDAAAGQDAEADEGTAKAEEVLTGLLGEWADFDMPAKKLGQIVEIVRGPNPAETKVRDILAVCEGL